MAGCAMIGQSVINVKSGGRGRLSAFSAGVSLLLMVVFAGAWVAQIPMVALVAVLSMVAICTFTTSEKRRVGQECVSQCRSRRSPYHYKKTINTLQALEH